MKLRNIGFLGLLFLMGLPCMAHSVAFTSESPTTTAGTDIALTAAIAFTSSPGALGWVVVLPEGWTYLESTGPNVPEVTPRHGSTGTLEWAYTKTPASGAVFGFRAKVGGKPGTWRISAKAIVLTNGIAETSEAIPAMVQVMPLK